MLITNQPESFDLRLLSIPEYKKLKLLHLFHEAHTEDDKIDYDHLKLALGETLDMGKHAIEVLKRMRYFRPFNHHSTVDDYNSLILKDELHYGDLHERNQQV